MNRKVILLLAAAVAVLGGWLLTQQVYAAGTTLTVNGFGDFTDLNPGDGICDAIDFLAGDQCSLRAAIEELNALGSDTTPHRIEFNIAGTGPFTIMPNSELPGIDVPVVIDGETQPGASCPTSNNPANLQIVLDGSNAGQFSAGLVLGVGNDGNTIRGLVIGNFDISGIQINSDDNRVACTHIGLGADGISEMSNGSYGITINTDENTIGGQAAAFQRNVINGGINVAGESNRIANNFFGTTADGMNALGGGQVFLGGSSSDNQVGGAAELARNVIQAGFGQVALRIGGGNNNVILGNYIGVAKDGVTPLPIAIGISIESDATGNAIGGILPGEGNVIANSSNVGIRVGDSGPAVQNEIRGNAIYANGDLGIDLNEDGVDINDLGDADSGANEGQNFPILTTSPGSFLIDGTLSGKSNTTYQIDFYRNEVCDSSGFGEGELYLASQSVTTGIIGFGAFQFQAVNAVTGEFITATATDPNGNTSEFSACVQLDDVPLITPTVPTVTPTPSSTPTNTTIPTNTPTATTTSTPTITSSPTVGPSPTATNTPPPANTPTPTGSATPTAAFTPTPTATNSPTPGSSPTPTLPPEITPTATAIASPTPDPTQDDSYFIYLPIIIR